MTDETSTPAACVTCDTPLHGPYCHACGERSLAADDPRVMTFLREASAGAFDLDSRLWRSFAKLLRRPGFLTAEYMRGRRRPYVAPVQLFLLCNLVFFLILGSLGGFSTFTTRLVHHRSGPFYGELAGELVDRHGGPGTPAAADFERRFDEATPRYANSMVILMVPLLAVLMQLLAPRRYFVHHLAFAFHFMSFLLLVIAVLPMLLTVVIRLVPLPTAWLNSEGPVSVVLLATFLLYLQSAWRNAYGGSAAGGWLRAAATVVMLIPVVTVYRMVLFFVVYYRL